MRQNEAGRFAILILLLGNKRELHRLSEAKPGYKDFPPFQAPIARPDPSGSFSFLDLCSEQRQRNEVQTEHLQAGLLRTMPPPQIRTAQQDPIRSSLLAQRTKRATDRLSGSPAAGLPCRPRRAGGSSLHQAQAVLRTPYVRAQPVLCFYEGGSVIQ